MATLDSGFEDAAREAVLDSAEETLREDIGPTLKQTARENFESYANRNDYDIEHIWQDASGPFVERRGDSITLRVEWPGLTALYEFGVSPHTIDGDPLLAFIWESPPEGTRPPDAPGFVVAESVNWGSVTGGIPEARAIRDALNDLRRNLE